jgi:hypothetical protein
MGLGVEDAALIGPLAFVLVAATVTVHGFTLGPFARTLGLTATEAPGVLLVGGARWTTELGEALKRAEIPVIVADANRQRLLSARKAGLPVFFGDVLSQAAEHGLDLVGYPTVLAASDNDAYNTLVATDFGREVGRETVFQVRREAAESARHALPATLGGSPFGDDATFRENERRAWDGWGYRLTRLTEAYTLEQWRAEHPQSVIVGVTDTAGRFRFVADDSPGKVGPGMRLLNLHPPVANGGASAEQPAASPDTAQR